MGTIKRGILGGFSGKVAGVVGSSWKGIAVIKALPLSVANPNTAAQSGNRTAFKAVGQAGSDLLTQIVKPLWDRDAQRQSGYNAFMSSNKQAYSTAGVLTVADFIMSLGKLAASAITTITITDASTEVSATWTDDSGEGDKLATDVAYLIAYNADTDEWAQSSGAETRSDEGAAIDFESVASTGDVISVWLAFKSADGFKLYAPGSDLSNTVQ